MPTQLILSGFTLWMVEEPNPGRPDTPSIRIRVSVASNRYDNGKQTFIWSDRRGQQDRANDDQDDRKSAPEGQHVAGEFAKEKENADGGDDRRAH